MTAGATVSLDDFDLNLLRVLDALLDERQVSAAARRLGVSQPAMSSALGRLRKALNDPLLTRAGQKMSLTPLAVELQPRVRRALDDIGSALQAATSFDLGTTDRVFRIGADDYSSVVLLAALAGRMRRDAPRATLEIWPFEENFEERLAMRDWDLAVTDHWALRGWQHRDVLLHETFVSLAREDHPRLGDSIDLERFLAEDHALISRRGRTAGVIDGGLQVLSRRRRVALTFPHYLAAGSMIAGTDLVMTLPRRIAARISERDRVQCFETPLDLDGFDVAAAYHPRSVGDAGIVWLRGLLRTSAQLIGNSPNPPPPALPHRDSR
jgi:DNA-binding transcriptional LysR family regulator